MKKTGWCQSGGRKRQYGDVFEDRCHSYCNGEIWMETSGTRKNNASYCCPGKTK